MKKNEERIISIIVPIFKKEDTIKRCIDSIIKQSYHKLEILLIDDGSPDSCGMICDEYKKIDNRIKVFHQDNAGVSAARNLGIEYSHGDFLTFVDADDILESDFIESFIGEIDDSIDVIVESSHRQNKCFKKDMTNKEAIKSMFLDDNFGVNVWGKLYKRSLFVDVKFPLGVKMGEDLNTLYDILKKAEKVIYLSKNHYQQMESNFSSINNVDINEFFYSLLLVEKIYKNLESEFYDCKEAIQVGLVKRCIWMINLMLQRNMIDSDIYKFCLGYIKKYKNIKRTCSLKYKIGIVMNVYFPRIYCWIYRLRRKQ